MSSNSERVKRWREKNRGLHNLRRRKAYQEKKNLSVPVLAEQLSPSRAAKAELSQVRGEARESTKSEKTLPTGNQKEDSRGAQNPTIQTLRQLIKNPQPIEPKPSIYRNDYGQLITERVWKMLQERKAKARAGNYVLDDYSQT